MHTGERVRSHFNLHRLDYSIVSPATGRVIASADTLTLANVTFRVQPGGLRRIRAKGQREVCAYCVGTLVATDAAPCLEGWRRITFNPHRTDTFVYADTGEPAHSAELVVLSGRYAWAPA